MRDIRENPPEFIRTDEQLMYYETIYDDLVENKTALQFKDRSTLGMLAVNLALVDECLDSITDDGMTITYQGDRKEITKINPAVGMIKDAQLQIKHYLKEFGMSPNSRTTGFSVGAGLQTKGKDKQDKIGKFLR